MSDTAFPLLTALRDVLGAVPGVVTSKVGFEANMTAADYPCIRVVPSQIAYGGLTQTRKIDVLIYLSLAQHDFQTDLEALWSSLLSMEQSILTALETSQSIRFDYARTILDEDRIDSGYKMLCIQGSIEG